ncbi:hypothetical protein, partial [Gehongia tenuis]|uniref:hypothetical protein n=1 Tax=Gehongia tenuis TaxID=2763655 RepID=UPI0020162A27
VQCHCDDQRYQIPDGFLSQVPKIMSHVLPSVQKLFLLLSGNLCNVSDGVQSLKPTIGSPSS